MTDLQLARQQIALNVVLIGVGVLIFFLPQLLSLPDLALLRLLLVIVHCVLGLYVGGLGLAGIIEGGIRMARSIED